MQKNTQRLLLIWDIFLTHWILLGFTSVFGVPIPDIPVIGEFLKMDLLLAYAAQMFFLPQFVSILLIVLHIILFAINFRFLSLRKEVPWGLVLIIWCVICAAAALWVLMFQDARGVPLP